MPKNIQSMLDSYGRFGLGPEKMRQLERILQLRQIGPTQTNSLITDAARNDLAVGRGYVPEGTKDVLGQTVKNTPGITQSRQNILDFIDEYSKPQQAINTTIENQAPKSEIRSQTNKTVVQTPKADSARPEPTQIRPMKSKAKPTPRPFKAPTEFKPQISPQGEIERQVARMTELTKPTTPSGKPNALAKVQQYLRNIKVPPAASKAAAGLGKIGLKGLQAGGMLLAGRSDGSERLLMAALSANDAINLGKGLTGKKPGATPQALDSGMTNNTSVKPITADGASSPSFYEAVKRGPDGSGNRDTAPPTPGNIPQFGTQMGSRVTIDSMKGYLEGRGLSDHLRNPFSSNQLAGTEEHSKALSGAQTPQAGDQEVLEAKNRIETGLVEPTETPKDGLSDISKIFLGKLKDTSRDAVGTMQAAREAQAMRGKFTVDNRYYMNAPQTKDGLVEVSKKQYDRLDGSKDVAQNVLDEQVEFGNLVQEQKDKFAGKSVAEVNAAYSAMSDEDKKKYGMAMHAAHFGKFNTPEIETPAAAQNPVFDTGFNQSVVEGAGLPSGLVSYNSDRPVVMQEQNTTINPVTLQETFQTKEKPLSQDFFEKYKNSFEQKLFG